MERNLETLKDVLWTQFERAASYELNHYDSDIQERQAIALLANAIVNVEREIRENKAEGRTLNKSVSNS
jgi:hypothetical protein